MKMLLILIFFLSNYSYSRTNQFYKGASSKKNKKKSITKAIDFNDAAGSTYRKYENTLTLHVTRPPKDIKWKKKSRNLLLSVVSNQLFRKKITKRAIGHVTVELNCTLDGAKTRKIYGQGAVDLGQYRTKILKNKLGLSILLTPEQQANDDRLRNYPLVTIDGKLETEEDLLTEYSQNITKGDLMNFVSYKVSAHQCQQMLEFAEEYKRLTKSTTDQGANRYGFGANTDLNEGAGCIAYVGKYLKIAGLGNHYKQLFESIYIKENLLGNEKDKKVKLSTILFDGQSLATNGDDKIKISFPDPNILYKLIDKASERFNGMNVIEQGFLPGTAAKYIIVAPKRK